MFQSKKMIVLRTIVLLGVISISLFVFHKLTQTPDVPQDSSMQIRKITETKIHTNITSILNKLIGEKNYHLTVQVMFNQEHEEVEKVTLEPLKVTQSYTEKKQKPGLFGSMPGLPRNVGSKNLPGFPTSNTLAGDVKPSKPFNTIEQENDVIYYNQVKSRVETPVHKIDKLIISLLIDEKRVNKDELDMTLLEKLVKNAASFEDERNDEFVVTIYPISSQGVVANTFRSINNSPNRIPLLAVLSILVFVSCVATIYVLIKLVRLYRNRILDRLKQFRERKEREAQRKKDTEYNRRKLIITDFAKSHPHDFAKRIMQWVEIDE
ncbi:hypothetical protein HOH87_04195 [bacterium]|jgi:flagellar biosynthesis/type III secretory pathway M-ring protein FliF/YscJ|nr:hypothetical protein [bacterium]